MSSEVASGERRNGENSSATDLRLVYRLSPNNGTVVFATPARALLIDQLHKAIRTSRTWAEFRKTMPRTAYAEIERAYEESGEPMPEDADEFSSEQIPGFDDGDYPPWLQREMDKVLPTSVLQRFAVREAGFTSGSFWSIPAANQAKAVLALETIGFSVEQAEDLEFW